MHICAAWQRRSRDLAQPIKRKACNGRFKDQITAYRKRDPKTMRDQVQILSRLTACSFFLCKGKSTRRCCSRERICSHKKECASMDNISIPCMNVLWYNFCGLFGPHDKNPRLPGVLFYFSRYSRSSYIWTAFLICRSMSFLAQPGS